MGLQKGLFKTPKDKVKFKLHGTSSWWKSLNLKVINMTFQVFTLDVLTHYQIVKIVMWMTYHLNTPRTFHNVFPCNPMTNQEIKGVF